MGAMAKSSMEATSSTTMDWLKEQMSKLHSNPMPSEEEEKERKLKEEREAALADLKRQQDELQAKIRELESPKPLREPQAQSSGGDAVSQENTYFSSSGWPCQARKKKTPTKFYSKPSSLNRTRPLEREASAP